MDMEEIKQTFFVECEEQLAELESGLLEMEEACNSLWANKQAQSDPL